MVAAKGKVSIGTSRVIGDTLSHGNGTVRNFKVYLDNENDKPDGTRKKISKQLNRVDPVTTATDPKGCSKVGGKIKGQHDGPVNQNLRRKALADVSNVRSNFSKNMTCDGPKPMTSGRKSYMAANLSRKSSLVLPSIKDASSKSFLGAHSTQRGLKNLKPRSDNQRAHTKISSCESISDNGRNSKSSLPLMRNSKSSLPLMRKSLPILKRMNQAEAMNAKENNETSERAKRINGFPVKAKVNSKIGRRVSIGRSHLWRSRISDGFVIMAPKNQTTVGAHVSSRKPIRPMVNTAVKASSSYRTSTSKCKSDAKRSISTAVVSSAKEDKASTLLLENIPVVISHHATREPSFDHNTNSYSNQTDTLTKRKSDRRRSFTSLLMTSSKLVEGLGEASKHDKLPAIDDNCNQLEAAEYVHEIYQYYWVTEAQNPSLWNYMSMQTDITPRMRSILINWLIEVHFKFELMPETLYLTVTLLDQFLSQVKIRANEMQLVGLTVLLLASKYEDFWHPRIKDLISISAESYTRAQVLAMEKLILKKLKFRLNAPTPYVFMLRFLKAAQSDTELDRLAFYLIELCLVEYEALKFKPSMLCASAIYVARSTLLKTPIWTNLLVKHSRYEVSQIRECAEMILQFQKDARASHLKVTYEKYTAPDLSCVSAIKPLDKLPPSP